MGPVCPAVLYFAGVSGLLEYFGWIVAGQKNIKVRKAGIERTVTAEGVRNNDFGVFVLVLTGIFGCLFVAILPVFGKEEREKASVDVDKKNKTGDIKNKKGSQNDFLPFDLVRYSKL